MGVSISENLVKVTERLVKAARKAGRDPSEITLIAVTKTLDVKKVREAVKNGLRVFGENYIQEAQEKIKKIKNGAKKWHFLGHLQKNKVKYAVELFDCIHTVDSPGLAVEINKKAKKPIDILMQVNISGEKTKSGIAPDKAVELARSISGLKNLRLRGLMAIPPLFENPEQTRPFFVTLRRLAERINRQHIPGIFLRDLSMGMSADFDVAIEEGATMVRVGSAIFGPRETPEEKKPVKKAVKEPVKKAATKKAAKRPVKKAVKKKAPKKPAKKAVVVKKAKKAVKKAQKPAKAKPGAKKAAKTIKAKKAVTTKKTVKAKKKSKPAKKTKTAGKTGRRS